jgi:hypothetical protein
MPRTPARRELGFVLAVAFAGLAAVLLVAFAPWYPADPPSAGGITGVGHEIARLIGDRDGGAGLQP